MNKSGDLWKLAEWGTFEDFAAKFEPGAENWVQVDEPMIFHAVKNSQPEMRVALCNFLLDRGADPTPRVGREGFTVAHILLSRARPDPVPEAALLRRFVDCGVDVNAVAKGKKWGTCLQMLTGQFQFSDEYFSPFYDVFFSCPDLDLLQPAAYGVSTYELIRRGGATRLGLMARMDEYLALRGIEAPDPVPPGSAG